MDRFATGKSIEFKEGEGHWCIAYGLKNNIVISGDAVDKLAHYEDLEEQGRLIELPCEIGSTVYVLAECKNIQPQLDGTLYSADGSPGTATGYYCPYEDNCPHLDFSDDCDKCKDVTAVFEDEVTSIIIDDLGVQLFTDTCGVSGYLGDYIFLTKEEAENKLKEMEQS